MAAVIALIVLSTTGVVVAAPTGGPGGHNGDFGNRNFGNNRFYGNYGGLYSYPYLPYPGYSYYGYPYPYCSCSNSLPGYYINGICSSYNGVPC